MSTIQELRAMVVEAAVTFRHAEIVRNDAYDVYVTADSVRHAAHITLCKAVAALEANTREQVTR